MPVTVRGIRPGEEAVFLDMHGRAVRGLAAEHYPPNIIDAWGARATEQAIQRFRANPEGEIRLVAELDGVPSGLGAVVPQNSELRACYVVPEAARRGVGSALVREMERIAKDAGVVRLELRSSLNAQAFYLALGYEALEPTQHLLGGRLPMAAIRMARTLK